MRETANIAAAAVSPAGNLAGTGMPPSVAGVADARTTELDSKVACARKPGNRIVFLTMGNVFGSVEIALPLITAKERPVGHASFRGQVRDTQLNNPATTVPAVGMQKTLSEAEVDTPVDGLYTL